MPGDGSRISYGRPGVRGPVAVGLWAHPAAIDIDNDGDTDLIIGCPDRPYNGTYLFRNIGSQREPLYAPAERLGKGHKDIVIADFNGDTAPDLVIAGGYYSDIRRNLLSKFITIDLKPAYHIGRDNLWHPVDWDRDGKIDLLNGVSDWRDYGWDDAYDAKGNWTRGPLHGYVWFHRNTGTNEKPTYAPAVKLPIDQYGSPSPNPVDWLANGQWSLLTGSFLDYLTLYRATPTGLAAPENLPFKMDLCMIQPRIVHWHNDKRPSILIGEEDGTVSLAENQSPQGQEPRFSPPRKLIQLDPYLKSGALSRPIATDWNNDGKLDLLSGNSAGYVQYFENIGTRRQPIFEDRGNLKAAGQTIRHQAGENGSIQGPAEAKWGYTNPWAADWDLDKRTDLLVNDIKGEVVWYRRAADGSLESARPIEVEWPGPPPKPDWIWYEPRGKQLLTQWRTTPRVIDWNRDGLPDLVMLNHQGYLCLYPRARRGGKLVLLPPEKHFVDPNGRFLNLANGRAGRSGRRKIEFTDWDNDGDQDLVTDSDDGPIWFENLNQAKLTTLASRSLLASARLPGHNPTPNFADWNNDGRPDLIIGAEDGFFYYYERSRLEVSLKTQP